VRFSAGETAIPIWSLPDGALINRNPEPMSINARKTLGDPGHEAQQSGTSIHARLKQLNGRYRLKAFPSRCSHCRGQSDRISNGLLGNPVAI